MASKVALILTYGSNSNTRLIEDLKTIGYDASTATEYDSQKFDIALVCLTSRFNSNKYNDYKVNILGKPTVFVVLNETPSPIILNEIKSKAVLNPNYTVRELELVIELAKYEAKDQLIEPFIVNNKDSDHARLHNLLSEEMAWQIVFEQLPNGVVLASKNGSIVYSNKATIQILGYSHVELLNLSLVDLTTPTEKGKIAEIINQVLDGCDSTIEVYNIKKDGSLCYVLMYLTRVNYPDGTQGILSTLSDITSTTKINQDLLDSVGKFKIIIEQANIGIVYIQNGKILYANPFIKQLLDYDSTYVIDKPISDYIHINSRNQLLNRYKNRLNDVQEINNYESELIKRDGSSMPVSINANLFKHNKETITIVFIKDISHQKENEKVIQDSEESFRRIFSNAIYGIFILDMAGIVLDVNLAGINCSKYSKQELIGMAITDFPTTEKFSREDFIRRIRLAYQGTNQSFEFALINKEGNTIPLDVTLSKSKYFGLDVVIATMHDISKRKNAEKTLVESEEKYRSLTEQLSLGLFRTHTNGEIIFSNLAFVKMLGIKSQDELLGRNISEFVGNYFVTDILLRGKSQKEYTFETSIATSNRQKTWAKIIAKPISSIQGNLLYFDCIIENISDLKLATDTLRERESRLNAMFAAVPDQIYKVDDKCFLIDYKSAKKGNYPTVSDTNIGQSIANFFPYKCYSIISEAIAQCNETGLIQEVECKTEKNDQELYYEIRVVPIVDNFFLILQHDITKRKSFEERVRMLAQVVETANDAISIARPDGTIIYVNPAFCKTYGFSLDEIIGQNAQLIRTPDFNQQLSNEINTETIKQGWQGEVINVRSDGSVFPVYLSTSTVYDENNEPKVTVGLARNITDQKRTERELIRAKERAEESDRLKTAFLSNLSHEIRSPMNAVMGFVQLIKWEENLSEAGIQNINQVQESGNQLLSLIEDIIDISKIQTNQLNLKISPFNLNQLFLELYGSFKEQINKKNLSISLLKPEVANETQFIIKSDYIRIRQILSHLLANAVKFTPQGSIRFGYTLIVDDYSPKVQFFVNDTGIGISTSKQMQIFDLFRQGDDSFTRAYGGSGLGLAISKGLVENLGGNIWVESEIDIGSTFYFTIPYNHKSTYADEKNAPAILLVEQPDSIKFYYDELFPLINTRVMLATNADEARRLFFHEGNVKVVIIDTEILDSDNYKIINDFKQAKPSIKIIAQAKIAMQDELKMITSSGCDDYIVKNRNITELLSRIREYISNS